MTDLFDIELTETTRFPNLDDEKVCRAYALRLAVDLGSSRIDTSSADVLADAALFDAFLRGATGPATEDPAAHLLALLVCVDLGHVTFDLDESTTYHDAPDVAGRLDVSTAVRAAEAAGLVTRPEESTRWQLTARGSETKARGQI